MAKAYVLSFDFRSNTERQTSTTRYIFYLAGKTRANIITVQQVKKQSLLLSLALSHAAVFQSKHKRRKWPRAERVMSPTLEDNGLS